VQPNDERVPIHHRLALGPVKPANRALHQNAAWDDGAAFARERQRSSDVEALSRDRGDVRMRPGGRMSRMSQPISLAIVLWLVSGGGFVDGAPPAQHPRRPKRVLSISGFTPEASDSSIRESFGRPASFSTLQNTHYVKGDRFLHVEVFEDGTRTIGGGVLELNGSAVARVSDTIVLATVEKLLGERAVRIASEHDAVWYRFAEARLDVAVGVHGTARGKVRLFELRREPAKQQEAPR
jgi:hypothetical protein